MTKLPIGTLENIEISQIRALLKENKAISGFKEYFREQVQSSLEDKGEFGKEDFEVLKEYIENLKEYQKLLKEEFPNKSLTINVVKKLILGQTIDEFKAFFDNFYIGYLLMYLKENNLEYLFKLNNIETVNDLEDFMDNDYIRRIIENSNFETLKVIIDFLDIKNDNFNIFAFNTDILELSINIDSEILAYLLDLYEVKKGINGISNLNKFASIYSSSARNLTKGLLENLKIFDREIQKQMINEVGAYSLRKLEKDFDKIKNHKYGKEFGFFIEAPRHGGHFSFPETFPVNLSNFLDFMQDDETLFEFEETGTKFTGTKPWTKAWFMEKPERVEYVNSHDLEDLNKLGLIPGSLNNAISNFATKNIYLWESLAKFVYKKVIPSKHNRKVFIENNIIPNTAFNKILTYYLENKQNSIIPMMEKLSFIEEFGLDIDLDNFKTIDDFRDENGELKVAELKRNFEKILKINNENKQEKLLNQLDNLITRKNIEGLEKLLMDNLIKYFDYIYHKKIKIKVISSIKASLGSQNIDFDSIDNAKLDREDFIEAYKMSLNPTYNKRQINKLLLDYLIGKFDNLEDLNQYKTLGNIDWLDGNLSKEQQEIWLSKDRKEINLEDKIDENNEDVSGNENIESRINNHIENIIKDISQLNEFGFEFEINFENKGELKKYFNTVIKKQEEEIKSKIGDSNLYEDLKFQMNAILKLETQNSSQNAKKSNSIIIEKELDPINSLMMGNWVDNSCLSFYSNVGNYYSAISNTIDANKGVYYIRNENGNLLGRCLITIGSDKKLSRYKMYYSGKIDDPIDEYFDEYTKDLAKRLGLELNGDQDNVRNIESDYWYKDGIKKINY